MKLRIVRSNRRTTMKPILSSRNSTKKITFFPRPRDLSCPASDHRQKHHPSPQVPPASSIGRGPPWFGANSSTFDRPLAKTRQSSWKDVLPKFRSCLRPSSRSPQSTWAIANGYARKPYRPLAKPDDHTWLIRAKDDTSTGRICSDCISGRYIRFSGDAGSTLPDMHPEWNTSGFIQKNW